MPAETWNREAAPQALIGRGEVRHTRLRPVLHRFSYPAYFLMLPMRRLRQQPCAALHRNGCGWLAFHDADHGEGGPDALAWIETLLAQAGVHDADGEIWLQCFPRVLGFAFKPVSFWFCQRADGALAAVVAEVNNTFGERHCYLLREPDGQALPWGRELSAAKVFHVSPFCSIEGRYRFRFLPAGHGNSARTVARIDHDDAHGPLLQTSISGRLAPLSAGSARAAFFAQPAFSLMLVLRIHWQALQLWLKRVPFFRKPAAPGEFLTR